MTCYDNETIGALALHRRLIYTHLKLETEAWYRLQILGAYERSPLFLLRHFYLFIYLFISLFLYFFIFQ